MNKALSKYYMQFPLSQNVTKASYKQSSYKNRKIYDTGKHKQ